MAWQDQAREADLRSRRVGDDALERESVAITDLIAAQAEAMRAEAGDQSRWGDRGQWMFFVLAGLCIVGAVVLGLHGAWGVAIALVAAPPLYALVQLLPDLGRQGRGATKVGTGDGTGDPGAGSS